MRRMRWSKRSKATTPCQELRTQWPEAELKRRDQSYRATSFMGSHLEDDSEAEEAGDEL